MTESSTVTNPTAVSTAPAIADQGLLARAVGIVFAPRKTFEVIAARPRGFWMMVILVVLTALVVSGFMMTSTGQQAMLDAAEKQAGASAQGLEMTRRMVPYMWIIYGVGSLVASPVVYLLMAGILLAVFTMLGGNATFKQVFAVVVYSSVISLVGACVTLPLNLATGSMTASTNLGVLLPMLDERSFLALLLGTIDLFRVWWVVVLAIGLAVVYKRRTGGVATTLFVIYGLIAVAYAAIAAARS